MINKSLRIFQHTPREAQPRFRMKLMMTTNFRSQNIIFLFHQNNLAFPGYKFFRPASSASRNAKHLCAWTLFNAPFTLARWTIYEGPTTSVDHLPWYNSLVAAWSTVLGTLLSPPKGCDFDEHLLPAPLQRSTSQGLWEQTGQHPRQDWPTCATSFRTSAHNSMRVVFSCFNDSSVIKWACSLFSDSVRASSASLSLSCLRASLFWRHSSSNVFSFNSSSLSRSSLSFSVKSFLNLNIFSSLRVFVLLQILQVPLQLSTLFFQLAFLRFQLVDFLESVLQLVLQILLNPQFIHALLYGFHLLDHVRHVQLLPEEILRGAITPGVGDARFLFGSDLVQILHFTSNLFD